MDTQEALKNKGWLSVGDIAKITGMDKADVRSELKDLLAKGLVQKTGKKRGTKYGPLGLEVPTKKDVDFKVEIRKFMEEQKDRVSRKQLCEFIGTYDAKIKPSLLAMVKDGEVLENGKKKGQLFWLRKHEEEGLIEPEPEPEPEPEENTEEKEDDPPITDVEELIKLGISSLKPGYLNGVMVDELKQHISSSANHNFTQAQIFECFHELLTGEMLPSVKYGNRNHNGYRMFYWVEEL